MTQPKKLGVSIFLNTKQLKKLQIGLVPNKMEDKWFAYFHDNAIHLHRSWTGYEIFKAELTIVEDGAEINEFWVEQNPEIYRELNDESNISSFKRRIEYLSNRDIPAP